MKTMLTAFLAVIALALAAFTYMAYELSVTGINITVAIGMYLSRLFG